jgi:hypothetical protein
LREGKKTVSLRFREGQGARFGPPFMTRLRCDRRKKLADYFHLCPHRSEFVSHDFGYQCSATPSRCFGRGSIRLLASSI